MNTSLQIVPATVAVPETIQGLGKNISINQHDTHQDGDFGALLSNLHAALSESRPPVLPGEAVAGELLAGLQELPDGGKLLPLLQETLDAAIAQGLDGEQLLDKLSASLGALEPAEAEKVAQSLSGLIQQLNSRIPVTTGNIANTSVGGAALSLPGDINTAAPQGHLTELIKQQLHPQAAGTQLNNMPDTAVLKQSLSEALPQASQAGLDKAMEQLQQHSQVTEGRQNDLALLMAAFKRQRADGAQRISADNTHPDVLTVAGGNIAVAANGTGVTSSTLPTTSVQTPFGQANWGQSVGERIQWMVGQKIQGAQVKLNPANLGPMEVRIQVQNDQASVQFTAHHAMVREALEAALPRLRDMFEASGVELVDVDVSGHSFAEQKATGEDSDGSGWGGGDAEGGTEPEMVLESEIASLENAGRVDLFA